jgi:hypothetical protein
MPLVARLELVAPLARACPCDLPEEVIGFFDPFRDRLLRYIVSFNLSQRDGEETVQGVFLALFRHPEIGRVSAKPSRVDISCGRQSRPETTPGQSEAARQAGIETRAESRCRCSLEPRRAAPCQTRRTATTSRVPSASRARPLLPSLACGRTSLSRNRAGAGGLSWSRSAIVGASPERLARASEI